MQRIIILTLVLVILGTGYYLTMTPGEPRPQNTGATLADQKPPGDIAAPDLLTFNVAPEKVDCVGVAPQQCLLVNGENFYDSIDGFAFQSDYQYVLLVARTERKDVPADASKYQYTLVEVISQTSVQTTLASTKWQW